MPDVYVALGSNMGHREKHIEAAALFLQDLDPNASFSRLFESEPVGPGTQAYLNAVVKFRTGIYPSVLFPRLKAFEIERGRDPLAARWTDRPLDLDIVAWGRRRFRSEKMVVPHASYAERLFVLLPLRDLTPDWIDPVTGIPIDEMIRLAPEMTIFPVQYLWPKR